MGVVSFISHQGRIYFFQQTCLQCIWTSRICLLYASIHWNRPDSTPMHVEDGQILTFWTFQNIFMTGSAPHTNEILQWCMQEVVLNKIVIAFTAKKYIKFVLISMWIFVMNMLLFGTMTILKIVSWRQECFRITSGSQMVDPHLVLTKCFQMFQNVSNRLSPLGKSVNYDKLGNVTCVHNVSKILTGSMNMLYEHLLNRSSRFMLRSLSLHCHIEPLSVQNLMSLNKYK